MNARRSSTDLNANLAAIQAHVAAAAGHPAPPRSATKNSRRAPTRVDVLAGKFGLSNFERDVLLLAALPALEPGAGALLAEAQGDSRLRLPTIAFALSALPDGHWSAFAADAPLRAGGLIELTDEPVASARGLMLSERVLHHLVGLDGIDQMLLAMATPLTLDVALARTQADLATDLGRRIAGASDDSAAPVFQLLGSDRGLAAGLAGAAARTSRRKAYLVDPEMLPNVAADRARIARLWSLETKLSGAIAVIDAHDATTPAELRAVARIAAAIAGPVILLAPDPVTFPYRATERLEVPRSTSAEQALLWSAALGPLAKQANGAVEKLATHFTASPDIIADVARLARASAMQKPRKSGKRKPKGGEDDKAARASKLGELLWRETRARTRPRLEELAQRIEARAGWDEIVLPPRQLDTLKAIAAQVRQRGQVYEGWGFAGHGGRGLGISALFAGPSGTGKTLAAEVIGAALGLDVYRIDLSAVVSKWIGETEKNLRRVFDAADDTSAILLFDEADALFGKRSEVRESHDRYANIEVSYLLQRMEAYRGLAVLTTNMRSHIDTAFLRRIRFMVEFPFPAEAERREIWRLAFPKGAPRDNLDVARLAQFNVPGGSIRNIALNAAFIAADRGAPIGMAHIRAAARSEYEKLGKTLTDGELRGWTPEARNG